MFNMKTKEQPPSLWERIGPLGRAGAIGALALIAAGSAEIAAVLGVGLWLGSRGKTPPERNG